jgi:D-alanyl-D-alanine carboxypeptidase/D-alanyl-D-alanine-endopeptidase (penicillin-binding protein 4)
MFFGTVLKETLNNSGIGLSGRVLTADKTYQPAGKPVIIDAVSTDLARTINVVNKRSQNFYAEQVLKSLAHHQLGKGTTEGGLRLTREFISEEIGINSDNFTISDGSGLSRRNVFAASQIIQLLKYMNGHKYFRVFRDSLNSERWAASGLQTAWVKTGYLKNTMAIAGYVGRDQDGYYVFSFILNGFEDPAGPGLKNAERFRDDFIRLLQNNK